MTLTSECTYAIARSRSTSPKLAEEYITVLMDGLRPQHTPAVAMTMTSCDTQVGVSAAPGVRGFVLLRLAV